MRRSESGVTLMELLIVVAIAGAMATLVLPAFSSGLDNLRLSQASDSVAAFLNGAHGYSRMFISGEVELRYGNTRAAARAGAGWLEGPLNDDRGFVLILIFAVLIVLSPFALGVMNYWLKL